MIVQGDTKHLCCVHNLLGHVDVRLAGRWITGRVIMHKDQGGRIKIKCAFDDLAGVNRDMINRALRLCFIRDDSVLCIQKAKLRDTLAAAKASKTGLGDTVNT